MGWTKAEIVPVQPAGWFMADALHRGQCAVVAELECFILERHWQKAGLGKEGALGVSSEKPKLGLGLGPFTTQAMLRDLDVDHSGVSLER